MKRNFIIRNIIIAVIVIAIIAGGTYYFYNKRNNKVEETKVNEYNYFVLKQNDLSGVINRNGEKLIEATYDDVKIPNPEKPVFVCYEADEIKVLNEKGEKILTQYEKVEPIRLKNITSDLMYEKGVLKYKENGKYGLINFKEKKITKAIYDDIEGLPYKETILLVKQENKNGIINVKGEKIIDPAYDQISVDGYYTDDEGYKYAGYIISNKTDEGYRYGYANYKGKMLLKPEYNQLSRIIEIEDNENSYIICSKNGQFGVTKNEKEIINNQYQSIAYDENNNLLVVEKSKKYGVLTLEGGTVLKEQYNQIDITGSYLYAENDEGVTVYNNNGTKADIDVNTSILDTNNENYKIKIESQNDVTKYGVIGKSKEQIIEEKYNYVEYLFDNYFIVSNENSKLGIIDDKDDIKLEIDNDSLQKIENTSIIQSTISKDKVTKLYDENIKPICEMQNASIEVKDDYVKIHNNMQVRYFDKKGKELKNTDVYRNNTLFAQTKNNKWGFMDKDGNTVIEAKYDKVTEFNEYGFAAVKSNR